MSALQVIAVIATAFGRLRPGRLLLPLVGAASGKDGIDVDDVRLHNEGKKNSIISDADPIISA